MDDLDFELAELRLIIQQTAKSITDQEQIIASKRLLGLRLDSSIEHLNDLQQSLSAYKAQFELLAPPAETFAA